MHRGSYLVSIETRRDGVFFNLSYRYIKPSIEVYIPIEKLTWSSEKQSGEVSVYWTDAYLRNKNLLMPPSEYVSYRYTVSFKLHGAENEDIVKLEVPIVINDVFVLVNYEFQVKDIP